MYSSEVYIYSISYFLRFCIYHWQWCSCITNTVLQFQIQLHYWKANTYTANFKIIFRWIFIILKIIWYKVVDLNEIFKIKLNSFQEFNFCSRFKYHKGYYWHIWANIKFADIFFCPPRIPTPVEFRHIALDIDHAGRQICRHNLPNMK